jgi:hypothetical protein
LSNLHPSARVIHALVCAPPPCLLTLSLSSSFSTRLHMAFMNEMTFIYTTCVKRWRSSIDTGPFPYKVFICQRRRELVNRNYLLALQPAVVGKRRPTCLNIVLFPDSPAPKRSNLIFCVCILNHLALPRACAHAANLLFVLLRHQLIQGLAALYIRIICGQDTPHCSTLAPFRVCACM